MSFKEKTQQIWNNHILPLLFTGLYGAGIFLSIHAAFFAIEQIHYRWCVSHGLSGFFTSILTNGSGICTHLRRASLAAANATSNLISVFASFLAGWALSHKKKEDPAIAAELQEMHQNLKPENSGTAKPLFHSKGK